jgi:hypothetical protein
MTHAHQFSVRMTHVQPAAAVLDAGRLVASASSVLSPTAATVAWLSIPTTVWPLAGTPRCNSAPSVALAETSFRIPSANTPGSAAAAPAVFSVACCRRVDFFGELSDLDWGSWEGSLPESSSLGGDRTPLRGAFTSIQLLRGFKNSLRGKTLQNFFGIGDILIAIGLRRLGSFWSAKVAHSFAASVTSGSAF